MATERTKIIVSGLIGVAIGVVVVVLALAIIGFATFSTFEVTGAP